MAGKKSIGQLHATVTADAAQFVTEFQRADNAARRHGDAITKEVGKIARDIERDFSPGKMVKGFLGGLGIGGGIELARTGLEKMRELFNASAERAKEMAEYVAEMGKELRELSEGRFNLALGDAKPGEKGALIGQRQAEVARQLAEAQDKFAQAVQDQALAGRQSPYFRTGGYVDEFTGEMSPDKFGGRFGTGQSAQDIGEAALKQQEDAGKQIETLRGKLAELKGKGEKAGEEAKKAVEKAVEELFKPLDEAEKAWATKVEALQRSVQNPEEKMRADIRAAWDAFNAGGIDEALRDRLIKKADKDFESATKTNLAPWEKAAGAVRADELTRRGLGSGADYAEGQKTTQSLLAEIRDILARQAARGFAPAAYGD